MRYNHNSHTPEVWEVIVFVNGVIYSFQSGDRSLIAELKRQLNEQDYAFREDITQEKAIRNNQTYFNRQELILNLHTFAAMLKTHFTFSMPIF